MANGEGIVNSLTGTDLDGRFRFGENWSRFLSTLDDSRLAYARDSLREMLRQQSLDGLRFLDVGSGSGIFSLAAVHLGAQRVHSFDVDPASVECTREMKGRFAPDADHWTIEPGSILDERYVQTLGKADIVYSWGVLHHTGDMFRAMENAAIPVPSGGRLFISIYNDQGPLSQRWHRIKRTYNALPGILRNPFVLLVMAPYEIRQLLEFTLRLRPRAYVRVWTDYKRERGMSYWHDLVDWCGGYPFEVATPEAVFRFFRDRGFRLDELKTCGGGWGCNQFVFVRE